jgi:hypothetical protein
MATGNGQDHEDISFHCPVWVCASAKGGDLRGGTRADGRRFVCVFRDEDKAARFLLACGESEHWLAIPILDSLSLIDLLKRLRSEGVALVEFDLAGTENESRNSYAISRIIQLAEQSLDEGNPN